MRDKLIELINNATEGFVENACQPGGAEKLADHLLANGVIIPPVKLGQTVWIVGSMCISGLFDEPCDEDPDFDCNNCTLLKKLCIFERNVNFIWWAYIVCGENDNFVWGKNVFATMEEAEKALAERSKS